MEVALDNLRQAENIQEDLAKVKEILEKKVNLETVPEGLKRNALNGN